MILMLVYVLLHFRKPPFVRESESIMVVWIGPTMPGMARCCPSEPPVTIVQHRSLTLPEGPSAVWPRNLRTPSVAACNKNNSTSDTRLSILQSIYNSTLRIEINGLSSRSWVLLRRGSTIAAASEEITNPRSYHRRHCSGPAGSEGWRRLPGAFALPSVDLRCR